MRTRTTKKKRKIGNKQAWVVCVCIIGSCALLGAAGDKPSQKNEAPHAVVAGTVFRESGFSLAGATVTLVVKNASKIKKLQSVTGSRGEFAFRVPSGAAAYVVRGSMKGFQTAEKEAAVSGEERVEVTLVLLSESK